MDYFISSQIEACVKGPKNFGNNQNGPRFELQLFLHIFVSVPLTFLYVQRYRQVFSIIAKTVNKVDRAHRERPLVVRKGHEVSWQSSVGKFLEIFQESERKRLESILGNVFDL